MSATKPMTTAEKIEAIESSGYKLAWDGCHKIYFLADEGREQIARDAGYEDTDIFPATELRELITSSCGLVFVTQIGAYNDDFEHPWNIDQCTEDIYAAAEAD